MIFHRYMLDKPYKAFYAIQNHVISAIMTQNKIKFSIK